MTALVVMNDLNSMADSINEHHRQAMGGAQTMVTHAMEAGDELILAKSRLRHGAWLPWLKQHIAFSEDTAELYMKAARNRETLEAHSERVRNLSLRTIPALLSAGPPAALISSNRDDWRTPRRYIEAAREALGDIDLDPASSAEANTVVRASHFYSVEENGLGYDWPGRVFLNPPYGRAGNSAESNQARWSRRLLDQYRRGITAAAILLVNATPSDGWWRPLWDFPVCFTDHRIRFISDDDSATAPTHSSAFVYLGPDADAFEAAFADIGVVAVRRTPRAAP